MPTRTHTVFFSAADLSDLRAVASVLSEDWKKRRPYIDDDGAVHRGDTRLRILESAIDLLSEPVD